MVLNVNNLKTLCIQHGERRTYFLRKKSIVSINAEKTNNAPNYVERFKVPTVLMVTNKNDHHDIAEILLKVALNKKQPTNQNYIIKKVIKIRLKG